MAAGLLTLAAWFGMATAAVTLLSRRKRTEQRHADRVAAERAARFGDITPGTDQDALDTCNAIWNTDQARKEKP